MKTLTSRWGIELVGHDADIANLEAKVNGSIRGDDDYFISRLDDCFVLRTSRWDAASDFGEAKLVASEDLSLLVSCMYAVDMSLGLTVGTVFHFREDGLIDQQRTSAPVYVRINPRDHALPDLFKNIVDAARSSIPLRVAASEITAEGGWFEIFKALEGLKRYFGNERKLLDAFPDKKSSIERMKRTANSYRHAAGSYDPITRPMPLHDAKKLAGELLIATLTTRKLPLEAAASTYGIPNIASAEGEPKFGLKPLILGAQNGTAYVGDTLTASE